MKRPASRHYSEEELLMHFLGEEPPNIGAEIEGHLAGCGECTAVFRDYGEVVGRIREWPVPQIPAEVWQARKEAVLQKVRSERAAGRGRGIVAAAAAQLATGWNYALEHPLPTLGYVAVAIAFALEQTVSTFRLDRVLPRASDVFAILRQVL